MIINFTCHTENCMNKDIAIPLEDPADLCICGPCGMEITDKVQVDGL
jgi:hypothetical protein